MEFIDANRDAVGAGARLGVEPIVTVLRDTGVAVAPSSYYARKTRLPSKRALRDEELAVELTRLWVDNYGVNGVRKLHKAARRAVLDIGRDQCRRLAAPVTGNGSSVPSSRSSDHDPPPRRSC